ncbi:unnamed protein product, partial [Iphiclides podalirius]
MEYHRVESGVNVESPNARYKPKSYGKKRFGHKSGYGFVDRAASVRGGGAQTMEHGSQIGASRPIAPPRALKLLVARSIGTLNSSVMLGASSKPPMLHVRLLVGAGSGNGGAATSPDGGSSSAAPLSPGGSGVAGGALSPGAGSHASTPAAPCCDTPRPIITDPVSGQTVCSCQYDARLALTSYPRLSSAVGVYGAPYPSSDQNPYPSIGVDSSAFYSPLVRIAVHAPVYTPRSERPRPDPLMIDKSTAKPAT